MPKSKFFLGLFVFILIVSFVFIYMGRIQRRDEVYNFLPQLKKFNLYDFKFIRIYADPSYKIPYNVLISFKTDAQDVFESLGLKNVHAVDTTALRSVTWVEEYRMYFTMHSVNAFRNKFVSDEETKVKWWRVTDCNDNYAAPYLDKDNRRRIVHFGEKKNGRIVCCKSDNIYYLLIECWG